jgi:hypothetical protein
MPPACESDFAGIISKFSHIPATLLVSNWISSGKSDKILRIAGSILKKNAKV